MSRNRYAFLMTTILLTLIATSVYALEVTHDLRISLDPGRKRLTGEDHLRFHSKGMERLDLFLNARTEIMRVMINDVDTPYSFSRSRLTLPLPGGMRNNPLKITVRYTALFQDEAPILPVNTDNPGYGVTGTISERGTLLLDGAGWYPRMAADRTVFQLQVEAPAGIVAVTAGRFLGHRTEEGRTISGWQVNTPVRGLSLSAGPYRIREKAVGNVTAATFFFEASAFLEKRYLGAVDRYLRMYAELFGPYPFEKFAVVENFFPTGYGFPSYTLLGSRVLRLPFIPDTSLGHEVAHCWWGNGVYVDHSQGNWSEGLATYVADYRFKEMDSKKEATEYRRQWLRNYASLVTPSEDFPIRRFRSRMDPVTKAIGYDKAAMVFHMLRRELGEDAFWGALRDFYRDYRFRTASWNQMRQVFEKWAGRNLKSFFSQWLDRKGAPLLSFDNVTLQKTSDAWQIEGTIRQSPARYTLNTDLMLETETGGTIKEAIRVNSARTAFNLLSQQKPRRLILDPEYHLFRRLHPGEIPPSINSLKGAKGVMLVLADETAEKLRNAAETLILSLGLTNPALVQESEAALMADSLAQSHLILVGSPRQEGIPMPDPSFFALENKGFRLRGSVYADPQHSLFGVFPHPLNPNRKLAVLHAQPNASPMAVARKVPHYGKYSFLIFLAARNTVQGVWPTTDSPMIVTWSD